MDNNFADQQSALFEKVGQRWRQVVAVKQGLLGVKVCFHVGLSILAWNEVVDSFHEHNKEPDTLTTTKALLSFAQAVHSSYETMKAMSELGEYRFAANATAQALFKAPVINPATHVAQLAPVEEKPSLYSSEGVGAALGTSMSLLDLYTSLRNAFGEAAHNDPAIAVSDLLQATADILIITKSLRTMNQLRRGEATVNVGKSVFEMGKAAAGKATADETSSVMRLAAEKLIGRDALATVGKVVSAFIPAIDLLDALMWLALLGSWIATWFEDNTFQVWAKQSVFTTDHHNVPYPDAWTQYAELVRRTVPFTGTVAPFGQTGSQAIVIGSFPTNVSDAKIDFTINTAVSFQGNQHWTATYPAPYHRLRHSVSLAPLAPVVVVDGSMLTALVVQQSFVDSLSVVSPAVQQGYYQAGNAQTQRLYAWQQLQPTQARVVVSASMHWSIPFGPHTVTWPTTPTQRQQWLQPSSLPVAVNTQSWTPAQLAQSSVPKDVKLQNQEPEPWRHKET